ncbi:type IV toxin-antitoxin system AbiEi family antitoxin domain-containing protein [Albimonas pacifica]|uniref:Transcriptional regulator with AbiEi antitoxin N-terminal domain n=1 Tax=Albimonas pacifica TaxID=1114924 RepID=A0A1I3DGT7_9RHOB|nr:type IV toxin-antitoxin system AbiEi family antitoxin domain-containing protein [Albimonas pacifica]SFH85866.1 transcriptional regulator with AbiEi antitoxin N-terminal domain [Albimonas pacifica]
MTDSRASHLNRLAQDLPEGLLVDGAWLEGHGIASNLRAYYVKSGWLDQPVRGVYRRPSRFLRDLSWQVVVLSLQNLLREDLVVGGRTALEMHGFSHYLDPEIRTVHLYGPRKPPVWVSRLGLPQSFVHHNNRTLFRNEPIAYGLGHLALDPVAGTARDTAQLRGGGIEEMTWGRWELPLTLSSPERAYLEMLDELPQRESFHQADMLMQGAANFRPRRLQKLLQDCASVKVKRLFFFFAERHGHAWLKRLDKSAVDLGKGKRMLVRGGRLDPVNLITVPEDLDAH